MENQSLGRIASKADLTAAKLKGIKDSSLEIMEVKITVALALQIHLARETTGSHRLPHRSPLSTRPGWDPTKIKEEVTTSAPLTPWPPTALATWLPSWLVGHSCSPSSFPAWFAGAPPLPPGVQLAFLLPGIMTPSQAS
ncbi:hypothetical protein Btru_050810 [Bulinus truncatus]|nr:hypothetical protein Btru_050810 [Bulinus truncatus]